MVLLSHPPQRRTEIKLVKPADLTPEHLSAWIEIQRDMTPAHSAFLHPQFVIAVGEVRRDVEVALIEEEGEIVGFFPFQRHRRIGRPVGYPLSDFQNIILNRDVTLDIKELIRQCGLKSWRFDHLSASQEDFRPYHLAESDSPYIDLKDGWDAYEAERKRVGSKVISSTLRKTRKLEEKVGPLRFEFHDLDDTAFQSLIEWKARQQEKTGAYGSLRHAWVIELLDRIRTTREGDFAGVLSTLYVDDHLVAIHLGMRDGEVLNSWVPSYDRNFAKYSPGLILLTRIFQACPSQGITRIDLGKGPEYYKQRLMSGSIPLAEGAVDLGYCRHLIDASYYRGLDWLRSSRLYSTARQTKKLVRRCARRIRSAST